MDLVCQFVKLVNEVIRLLIERSIKGERKLKKQLNSKKKWNVESTFKNTHFENISKCITFGTNSAHFENIFKVC